MIIQTDITVYHTQKDGRHYVKETHIHDDDSIEEYEYLAAVDADYNAIATVRREYLNSLIS